MGTKVRAPGGLGISYTSSAASTDPQQFLISQGLFILLTRVTQDTEPCCISRFFGSKDETASFQDVELHVSPTLLVERCLNPQTPQIRHTNHACISSALVAWVDDHFEHPAVQYRTGHDNTCTCTAFSRLVLCCSAFSAVLYSFHLFKDPFNSQKLCPTVVLILCNPSTVQHSTVEYSTYSTG